ncbi:MAG: hypothetical protein HYV15_08280 [Elusimicrobia bacterium]|nr:hypothetical protein [Elusimicrobiota bacterium]
MEGFEGALSANPWEVFYRLEYARLLYGAAQNSTGRDKAALIGRAVSQGGAAAALRPAEADGWAMLGAYLIVLRGAGGPDRLEEAAAALETAHSLDPFAPAVNANRELLAGFAGGTP